MSKTYYWLGEGTLLIDRKKPAILQDQEIPPTLLEKMSPKRLKNFIKRGSIGEIPKSASAGIAQKNLSQAYEKLKKENANLVKKNESREKEVERLTGENEKFKVLEKNLQSKNVLLEKLFKAHEDLKKINAELETTLQSKNGFLDKLGKVYEDLRKEYGELEKSIKAGELTKLTKFQKLKNILK